jgi:hydrogenase maturation protease
MERRPSPRRLVIGIGNPLRGDDGVGALLAEQLGGRSVQQLTPELAEELAGLEAVLFIDAWLAPAGARPELRQLISSGAAAESHRLEPEQLLAICEVLYGRSPRGHLLRVPAFAFGHGTALSAELREGLPLARRLLEAWWSDHA